MAGSPNLPEGKAGRKGRAFGSRIRGIGGSGCAERDRALFGGERPEGEATGAENRTVHVCLPVSLRVLRGGLPPRGRTMVHMHWKSRIYVRSLVLEKVSERLDAQAE